MLEREEFEKLVEEEFPRAIPEKFRGSIKNVALLVEDEPSLRVREEYELGEGDTLFGLYRGIPLPERGGHYGIGETMPDTITLYRVPILTHAGEDLAAIRKEIRDTIWHEVAHYFGFDEGKVGKRERDGSNYS